MQVLSLVRGWRKEAPKKGEDRFSKGDEQVETGSNTYRQLETWRLLVVEADWKRVYMSLPAFERVLTRCIICNRMYQLCLNA
mmetsp:Transcript_71290/g.112956  ORF Transcript_71290/g.112956 Transcript_71290/m.112956 type:complete len:82 (+) Transcript_71290:1019-1264(+)